MKKARFYLIGTLVVFSPVLARASDPGVSDYQMQMQRPIQLMKSVSQAHHCGLRDEHWTEESTSLLLAFAFAGAEKEWPSSSPAQASVEAQQQVHLVNNQMIVAAASGTNPTTDDCSTLLKSGDLDALDEAVKYMEAHQNDGQ